MVDKKVMAILIICIVILILGMTIVFTSNTSSQFLEGELLEFKHIENDQYKINLDNVTTTIKIPDEYFFSFTIGSYYIIELSSSNVIENIIEIKEE